MGKQRCSRRLIVSPEVFDLIVVQCKKLYLECHPEMQEIKITQNKIAYEIAKFYLEAP